MERAEAAWRSEHDLLSESNRYRTTVGMQPSGGRSEDVEKGFGTEAVSHGGKHVMLAVSG